MSLEKSPDTPEQEELEKAMDSAHDELDTVTYNIAMRQLNGEQASKDDVYKYLEAWLLYARSFTRALGRDTARRERVI